MAAAAKTLPACPVETTLTLISDKWKVLILRDLVPGTERFGELKKSVGNVSQKVLTSQLREMEQSGLLIRTVYPEVPPRVEYTLTDLGRSLKPILDAMRGWGGRNKPVPPGRRRPQCPHTPTKKEPGATGAGLFSFFLGGQLTPADPART